MKIDIENELCRFAKKVIKQGDFDDTDIHCCRDFILGLFLEEMKKEELKSYLRLKQLNKANKKIIELQEEIKNK